MLFSEFQRDDTGLRGYTEPAFTHLDRRAGPESDKVRSLIEAWLSHFPPDGRRELTARFRSLDDQAFHAAFFELYIHELLLLTGHTVALHPSLPDSLKRPDFSAECADHRPTIVEGTVLSETSTPDRSAEARVNQLRDSINRVESPDYFLQLRFFGAPQTSIPCKRWRTEIQAWVDTLDYDRVVTLGKQSRFDELPKLELSHDGLTVQIDPIAKKPESRGKSNARPLGPQSFEAKWVTSRKQIRERVKEKARRYPIPEQPYVLFVNCIGETCDRQEIEAAFFGRDGLWGNSKRPPHSRLSAVVAINHLFPWSVPRAEATMFHNPHARIRYTGPLAEMPQVSLNTGTIVALGGSHPRKFFQLDQSWPDD
jgi:hypothetical protein